MIDTLDGLVSVRLIVKVMVCECQKLDLLDLFFAFFNEYIVLLKIFSIDLTNA